MTERPRDILSVFGWLDMSSEFASCIFWAFWHQILALVGGDPDHFKTHVELIKILLILFLFLKGFELVHFKHPFKLSVYLTKCWKVGIWSWRDVSPDTAVEQETVSSRELSRWSFANVELLGFSFKTVISMATTDLGSWVNSVEWSQNLTQLGLPRKPSRISIRTAFSYCFSFWQETCRWCVINFYRFLDEFLLVPVN